MLMSTFINFHHIFPQCQLVEFVRSETLPVQRFAAPSPAPGTARPARPRERPATVPETTTVKRWRRHVPWHVSWRVSHVFTCFMGKVTCQLTCQLKQLWNCGTAGFEWLLVAFEWDMFENLKRWIRWNKQISRNKSLWNALKLSRLLVRMAGWHVTHSEIVRRAQYVCSKFVMACYAIVEQAVNRT